MSYTINPNAKNRWARNAENTMDLSLETEASSVYLDNGRTLEQEIGEGSMVSNIATIDSGMKKVTDGTYDGAYESCKMYGKSLVNVMTKVIDATWNLNLTNWSIETTSPSDLILKPNTMYSVIVYVTEKTCPDRDDLFWVGDVDGNKNKVTHDIVRKNVTLGANVFVINTVSDFSNLSSNKGGINFQGSKFVEGTLKWKAIVLEGDWTDKEVPPYFTGLCDVKVPILKNTGKNLCRYRNDFQSFGLTFTATKNGVIVNGVATRYVDYYVATPNESINYDTIHLLNSLPIGTTLVLSNNLGKNSYISYRIGNGDISYSRIVTVQKGMEIQGVFVRFQEGDRHSNDILTIQLEINSTPTTYEPHKTNILETSNDIVLRGLPNGVKDSYNCLTGEYVRRVGEVVLNGSENWANQNGENLVKDNTLIFSHGIVEMKDLTQQENDSDRELLCDKQKVMSSGSLWNTDKEGISKGVKTRDIRLRILKSKLSTEDINGLKLYLQANPITIQYELAEPIVTQIEPPTTPFAYKNGHIILESGHEGQSLLPMLEYSTVINKTGQVESVAKTIQRQEKQLTMLEQMLIQNIINLDYNNTLLTLKNEMEEML